MSRDEIIDNINSSGADFLVASLGARKGQLWLLHNHDRLLIPVRAHLGAAVNFQAGPSGALLPLCENSVLNGCGVSRKSPIFGNVIGMTEESCSAYYLPASAAYLLDVVGAA